MTRNPTRARKSKVRRQVKRMIQEVRILIEIPARTDTEAIDKGHKWLKRNIKNAVDWQQGNCYPEQEAPLQ